VTIWNRMRRFGVQYKKRMETGDETATIGNGLKF
jgi:hypothetical protein